MDTVGLHSIELDVEKYAKVKLTKIRSSFLDASTQSLFTVNVGITVHFLLFLASAEENEKHDSSDEVEGGEIQLEMVESTIGTLDLRESEIYPSRHRRRRRRMRKKEEPKLQNEGRSAPVCRHISGYSSYITETQERLFITQRFCSVDEISHPCVTELTNTEADNQEEEVPEAAPAEDAPQEAQSKNKRKRKAQSKKQLEGKCFFVTVYVVPISQSYNLL